MTLRLAYSPCPNDTYIFAALANGWLPDAPDVTVHLADIDELNRAAVRREFELMKVSYGAIPYLSRDYRILPAGGALGRGCGPLLVARPASSPELFADFARRTIAIPGERTTAFALLQMALGRRPPVVETRFDRIVDAVADGSVQAGLIVHESRFTYRERGLIAIADLGEWWETLTLLPIPLGAILVRNDVSNETARAANSAIVASLAYAREHESRVMEYVAAHSAEMRPEVMRAHIDLYVNEFSRDLGALGVEAAHAFFARGREAGVLPAGPEPQFVQPAA